MGAPVSHALASCSKSVKTAISRENPFQHGGRGQCPSFKASATKPSHGKPPSPKRSQGQASPLSPLPPPVANSRKRTPSWGKSLGSEAMETLPSKAVEFFYRAPAVNHHSSLDSLLGALKGSTRARSTNMSRRKRKKSWYKLKDKHLQQSFLSNRVVVRRERRKERKKNKCGPDAPEYASGFPANAAYIHTLDLTGNVSPIPNQLVKGLYRGWFV